MTSRTIATAMAAALGLITSNIALAQCEDPAIVEAARMQEFNTGMLVTQLRCRNVGLDFGAALIRFQTARGKPLIAAEQTLNRHFKAQPGYNPHDIDNFTTKLGNRYGTGALTLSLCGVFRDVAEELGKPETAEAMLQYYARAMVPQAPPVPGTCAAGGQAQIGQP